MNMDMITDITIMKKSDVVDEKEMIAVDEKETNAAVNN
jgi:hypothetical protein